MSQQPEDLNKVTKAELAETLKAITAKMNSIEAANKELVEENKRIKRASLVAKINSLHAEFKDDEKYSEDFLKGVAHGLSIAPKSNSVAKDASGQLPPVSGGDNDMVYTPNGFVKRSEAQGLAIREDIPPKEVDV